MRGLGFIHRWRHDVVVLAIGIITWSPFKTYYKSYYNVIKRGLRKKVRRLLIYSTVFGPFV
jgi:hypothetical protein